MSWELAGRPLRRVLVTRLRYLGDVVMSTVVLQALRLGDEDLTLGFLCEAAAAPVLEGHPLLARCHVLGGDRKGADARARMTHRDDGTGASGWWACARDLRAGQYDLAVDLFFNPRSAVLLKAAGIPLRIGGARGWRRRLYTHSVTEGGAVWPARFREELVPGGLGEHLGRLAPLKHRETGLDFPSWFMENVRTPLMPQLGIPGGGRGAPGPIVLAPGATWPAKEWPAGRWLELVELLLDRTARRLLVIQAPGRGGDWDSLQTLIPEDRGGLLPVRPLPGVLGTLAEAAVVVAVDGGIMHAAVGLGRPTVALFGPTEPGIWFPYSRDPSFRVLAAPPPCHPCHLHHCRAFSCLPGITALEAACAVEEVLAVGSRPGTDESRGG